MSFDDYDTTVLIIDTETTGINKGADQVIELAVQFGFSEIVDGAERPPSTTTWRFKPSVPIHPGAQKVHGISAADLEKCAPFKAHAFEISQLLADAMVLIGYNISFDLEMIDAEFSRAGLPTLNTMDKFIVDPYRLWQQCEPRGLMQAHERFVGGVFESAHAAAADIAATGRVALGMIDAFNLHGKDWGEIAELCDPDRKFWIGGSNHFKWTFTDGPPVAVVAFGKHKDTKLPDLVAANSGYLRWMQKQDFPSHVKLICQKAVTMRPPAFAAWLGTTFPPPAPPEAAP